MKKKLLSMLLVVCSLFALCGTALAAPPQIATPNAITAPTTYAPDSYYQVPHYWTCKYYTYSSYIFSSDKANFFYACADQSFTVDMYRPNGTKFFTAHSTNLYSTAGEYYINIPLHHGGDVGSFYVVISNDNSNSPITSNAYYILVGSPNDPTD